MLHVDPIPEMSASWYILMFFCSVITRDVLFLFTTLTFVRAVVYHVMTEVDFILECALLI
jgi:hypothetical protein